MIETAAGTPSLPPLFRGEAVKPGLDPFAKAIAAASLGADPGLIAWSEDAGAVRTAVVLAPEMPLDRAMGATFAALLGFSDALGALGPPEVAVHFVWPAGIKVNGARCGGLRAAASTNAPGEEPDWLVIGVDVPLLPAADDEPGRTPDETALHLEGCADLWPPQLIGAWARHMLVRLNRFLDDGLAPLHADWRAKCDTLGETVADPEPGVFMGLDELGGMILKSDDGTRVVPLTTMLEGSR